MLRIVSDGINYACGLTLAGLILSYFFNPYLGIPLYLLAVFCLWFFRDPERKTPLGDILVAPADGKVVSIKSMGPGQTRLSVFLNVFNVHVARAPAAGIISEQVYAKGKFRVASLESASAENEKCTFQLDGNDTRVTFSLVAGLIARRIVSYKKAGDHVKAGERVGLMKFGSRVDVFFGPEWQVAVKSGQKVSAGVTVIARRIAPENAQ